MGSPLGISTRTTRSRRSMTSDSARSPITSGGWTRASLLRNGASRCAHAKHTYPGVRHSVRFREAEALGQELDAELYAERYCGCTFCAGMFQAGQHPFELLLETQTVEMKNGRKRQIPTSRSVGANTWHFLLSRRTEVEAFSTHSAVQVIEKDIDRASALNRGNDVARLGQLAAELESA